MFKKIRQNTTVLHYLAVDNFDFTRKMAETIWMNKFLKTQLFRTFNFPWQINCKYLSVRNVWLTN